MLSSSDRKQIEIGNQPWWKTQPSKRRSTRGSWQSCRIESLVQRITTSFSVLSKNRPKYRWISSLPIHLRKCLSLRRATSTYLKHIVYSVMRKYLIDRQDYNWKIVTIMCIEHVSLTSWNLRISVHSVIRLFSMDIKHAWHLLKSKRTRSQKSLQQKRRNLQEKTLMML